MVVFAYLVTIEFVKLCAFVVEKEIFAVRVPLHNRKRCGYTVALGGVAESRGGFVIVNNHPTLRAPLQGRGRPRLPIVSLIV
jgi:hypothetical protein